MKKSILIVTIIMLLGIGYIIIFNFSKISETPQGNQESIISSESQTYSKQISELVLDISDFPEGYKLNGKGLRVDSDVSEKGLEKGWKEGYYAEFFKEDVMVGRTWIYQTASRYPFENVSAGMIIPKSTSDTVYEEIPINIGDECLAYRVIFTEIISGEEFKSIHYRIEFTKKDIYINMMIGGQVFSFELLSELAEKIEKKI